MTSIIKIEMEQLLTSKFLAYWGVATFTLAGIDEKFMDGIVLNILDINPIFTNLYMVMFTVYYIIKIYWYWQDKSLNKKERLKKLNN